MQSLEQESLVSVVIASYNMGHYLPQAVESICGGTYKNIEVIIIDDGSTDDTEQLIQGCLSDSRVKYIRKSNQGQPKAKNSGLKEARGEFIAFCDADDLWEPNKLELQIPQFSDATVGVVYSDNSHIDEANNRYSRPSSLVRHSGNVTKQLLIKNFVPFGTAVIRHKCLEKNGLFDEQFKMGIDWDLWLRYSLDWEFVFVPMPTYVYREWSGQMSSNFRGRYRHAFAILKNFEENFGHRLDRRDVRKAWADNYIGRARTYAEKEGLFLQPIKDAVVGLSLDTTNVAGWKFLIKVLLRWPAVMPKRKSWLMKVMEIMGVFSSVRYVLRMQPRILMYHRVIEIPHIQGVTSACFEQQMAYIAKKYRVVPIDQLVKEMAGGQLKPNTLAITFDDGHCDFYSNAWPILKKYKLPATLYVTTDFIDKKQWMWPDLLKYILLRVQHKKFTVDGLGVIDVYGQGVFETWNKISNHLLELSASQREKLMHSLVEAGEIQIPKSPEYPFSPVSWEQLQEMKAEGLDIGSHSITHPILATINADQIEKELGSSAQRIKEMTGGLPKGICYPNGRIQDINDQVVSVAKRIGYTYGLLALNYGFSEKSPYRLGRVAASSSFLDFKWRLINSKRIDNTGKKYYFFRSIPRGQLR